MALIKLPKFSTLIGGGLLIASLIVAIGIYYARQYAQIGAGMMAKQMCSCLYVQSRQEDECLAEMDQSIGKFAKHMKIVYFAKTQGVRSTGKDGASSLDFASFPDSVLVSFYGLAMTQAKMTPGFGCSVKKFNGQMPNGLSKLGQ